MVTVQGPLAASAQEWRQKQVLYAPHRLPVAGTPGSSGHATSGPGLLLVQAIPLENDAAAEEAKVPALEGDAAPLVSEDTPREAGTRDVASAEDAVVDVAADVPDVAAPDPAAADDATPELAAWEEDVPPDDDDLLELRKTWNRHLGNTRGWRRQQAP